MLSTEREWGRNLEKLRMDSAMISRRLVAILIIGSTGCAGSEPERFRWSEPLVATEDGGAIVLAKSAAVYGDIVEPMCSATRLVHVSAALEVSRIVTADSVLCALTRSGNARAGLDESGRLLVVDVFDGSRLKVFLVNQDPTTVRTEGCIDSDPVVAADSRSRLVAVDLGTCEPGSWIYLLRFTPDFSVAVTEDSVNLALPLRGMSFGPGPTSLMVQLRDSTTDRIDVMDLSNHRTMSVASGRLPAAQTSTPGFSFLQNQRADTDDWILMYSDSVGAVARNVLSRGTARERIRDWSAVISSAPILSLDGRYVWLGFGGKILRIEVGTGALDVVAP